MKKKTKKEKIRNSVTTVFYLDISFLYENI
jgi:hypothetical protein